MCNQYYYELLNHHVGKMRGWLSLAKISRDRLPMLPEIVRSPSGLRPIKDRHAGYPLRDGGVAGPEGQATRRGPLDSLTLEAV